TLKSPSYTKSVSWQHYPVSNCHCLPTYRLSSLNRSTITID
ncbi:transposase, partial [Shigella dysenteriae]